MNKMSILYAGDSPAGGPANYLLGILRKLKADVTHIPPAEKLSKALLSPRHDAILLSDFSAVHAPEESQKAIIKQIAGGSGLAMIGGWGSFSGPFGGWRGSSIEKILPVLCSAKDDRTNFPGGATIVPLRKHEILNSVRFSYSPAICGLNCFKPRPKSLTVLGVKKILSNGKTLRFEHRIHPLLVLGKYQKGRTAALATDLAPHWCGGWVDWGAKVERLPVADKIEIQVGSYYVAFVSSLIRWLAGR